MALKPKILILGGTTEAYALAAALVASDDWQVISSLAGRTPDPRLPAGETRIGGFGGVAGLAGYLAEQRIRAVIDATHPFAATMGWNAQAACQMAAVALLRLERPAWSAVPGDQWEPVADWDQAVAALQRGSSRRVLLAVGRQELAPFAGLSDIWFLIRAVSPPDPMPPFQSMRLLLARGPFDLKQERNLLDSDRIDSIVCKNSGGQATDAKLQAARERGLRVIMRQRPQRPELPTVATVEESLAWLDGQIARHA